MKIPSFGVKCVSNCTFKVVRNKAGWWLLTNLWSQTDLGSSPNSVLGSEMQTFISSAGGVGVASQGHLPKHRVAMIVTLQCSRWKVIQSNQLLSDLTC